MLLELIISTAIGICAGIFTGLVPGIHTNLVGVFLVSISGSFLFMNSIYLVIFIVSMTITHTFLDFIPSIFLGCPEAGETELSILPGHKMLKQGKGYEAVMLTAYGGLSAIILLLIIAFPSILLLNKFYDSINPFIPYLLILASIIMIFTEKRKFSALFVFAIAGILGLFILNLEIKEPLLPMLSGLFGCSSLILSIKNKTKIPLQFKTKVETSIWKPLLGSLISSPLCGFLPGLGSGQAAILGSTISKTDDKGFLVLLGATNTLVMGLSFIALFAIGKTRTGAAVAIQQLTGILSWKVLILVLIITLISGIVSFFLASKITQIISNKISKINYTKLSIITLIILSIIVGVISGFFGFLVLVISTLTGIYCISLNVKRTNMMACLLLPTIILYLL